MNSSVQQLPLPPLLVKLMAEGRWQQPEDSALARLVPFMAYPLDFLLTEVPMRRESRGSLADDPAMAPLFRMYRGHSSEERPLPWLDADRSLLIAVNRELGDDVAIALDYRTSFDDPRVVASEWGAGSEGTHWREVFPTFSAFAAALRLTD